MILFEVIKTAFNCMMRRKVAELCSNLKTIQHLQKEGFQNDAFSVEWAFTLKESNDRSPNMGLWIATVFLKSCGKYDWNCKKLTALSLLSQLSAQPAQRGKKGKMKIVNGNLNNILGLIVGLSQRCTSTTSRIALTISVLHSFTP